jgi:hypothetical protein
MDQDILQVYFFFKVSHTAGSSSRAFARSNTIVIPGWVKLASSLITDACQIAAASENFLVDKSFASASFDVLTKLVSYCFSLFVMTSSKAPAAFVVDGSMKRK